MKNSLIALLLIIITINNLTVSNNKKLSIKDNNNNSNTTNTTNTTTINPLRKSNTNQFYMDNKMKECTECASEGGICNLPDKKGYHVYYGTKIDHTTKGNKYREAYSYKFVENVNSIGCTNKIFKDPISGYKKNCYVCPYKRYSVKDSCVVLGGENEKIKLKSKNDVVYFGNRDYRYNTHSIESWVVREKHDKLEFTCDNNVFTDPLYGVKKYCYKCNRN